jgi:hypothetical protein
VNQEFGIAWRGGLLGFLGGGVNDGSGGTPFSHDGNVWVGACARGRVELRGATMEKGGFEEEDDGGRMGRRNLTPPIFI